MKWVIPLYTDSMEQLIKWEQGYTEELPDSLRIHNKSGRILTQSVWCFEVFKRGEVFKRAYLGDMSCLR